MPFASQLVISLSPVPVAVASRLGSQLRLKSSSPAAVGETAIVWVNVGETGIAKYGSTCPSIDDLISLGEQVRIVNHWINASSPPLEQYLGMLGAAGGEESTEVLLCRQ